MSIAGLRGLDTASKPNNSNDSAVMIFDFLKIFHFGVRQKVMLVLLSVLLIALTVSGWMALDEEKRNTLQEINQRGSDISRFVAKSLAFSVVGYDYHTIQLLLDEVISSDEISYAKVTSVKGNVMAESGSLNNQMDSEVVVFNEDIKLENDVVGSLTLGLSTASTIHRLESRKYTLLKREAIVILMIVFMEFLALSYVIIRPVTEISRSLQGNIDEDGRIVGHVPVKSKDEFGQLALLFNRLSSQLNDAHSRMQSRLEDADSQLTQTTKQLAMQSDELKRIGEEFKKMSVTDSLTGLYNRQRFEELMRSEMQISIRHGDVFSILLIDIDDFKSVNERFGHAGGDAVLKTVANSLKRILRKTDILCRVGGEEFVALCKRADKNAAIQIAENLCRYVESQTTFFAEKEISITISVGISTITEENANYHEKAYRQADIAIYHSKETGKNRATHYEDLMVTNKEKSENYVSLAGVKL